MINSFTLVAILISCLGLFGLSAFIAEQRTKEIGIRKVLGATVPQMAGMLSKDFLKLVLLASLIAFPIAWWLMNKWLENYQYHIVLHWSIFLLAGFIAIIIAMMTIGFQSIKASVANPIKSLRTE
jgi:putative ABC transport system permease protein